MDLRCVTLLSRRFTSVRYRDSVVHWVSSKTHLILCLETVLFGVYKVVTKRWYRILLDSTDYEDPRVGHRWSLIYRTRLIEDTLETNYYLRKIFILLLDLGFTHVSFRLTSPFPFCVSLTSEVSNNFLPLTMSQ